jgi:hypothetical protein
VCTGVKAAVRTSQGVGLASGSCSKQPLICSEDARISKADWMHSSQTFYRAFLFQKSCVMVIVIEFLMGG